MSDTNDNGKELAPASATPALPSEHLNHSAVLSNDLANRLAQFDSGITVLQAERDGRIAKFDAKAKKLAEEHEQGLRELEKQIEDLKSGKKMLEAALRVKETGQ